MIKRDIFIDFFFAFNDKITSPNNVFVAEGTMCQ